MFITYKYVCFNFFTFYSLPLFVDRQDLSIALNDVKCLKKKKVDYEFSYNFNLFFIKKVEDFSKIEIWKAPSQNGINLLVD